MIFTTDGILEELETQLSSLSEWRKTLFHGVYRRINSVIAYVLNKLVYLIEFYYKESSWDLATQIESLMARVEYYGYNPYRKVGASGNLALIGDPTWEIDLPDLTYYEYTGASVIIPQWTQFTDADEEIFVYSTEEVIYYTGTESYIDIPVKEGVPKEFLYIANGDVSEVVELNFDSIDNTEVYVYIVDANDNVLYNVLRAEVDVEDKLFFIYDMNNYYCSIKNSLSLDSIIITFGDGVKSKKLSLNERVLFKYAETQGAQGNITNTDVITVIKSDLVDANEDPAVLYVRNLEGIIGGSDQEDIESLRYNAPNLFNTGYRCGGYDDWKIILEADPRIYKAIIWSTDDIANDTLTQNQNKIYVTAISSIGEELTTAQQDDITINVLKAIKSPTEIVSWQPLNKIYARFDIEATIEGQPFTTAETLINSALNDAYDIFNSEFKTSIYESNFSSIINAQSFVKRHKSQMYHGEKKEYSIYNETILPSVLASEDSDPKNQIYIKEDSVELYARVISSGETEFGPAQRVGYMTGSSGVIIGDNGYTISGSAVIYNTNTISYTIDDLANLSVSEYEVMMSYITEDGNGDMINDIRIPKADIITDFDEAYNFYTLEYA